MMKQLLATAMLAVLATTSAGCIGSMAVSAEVRRVNMEVSEEPWPREIVFFVLYVIPVYPFAGAVDILVVNSIEFWTGTNPVSNKAAVVTVAQAGDVHREVGDDGTVVLSTRGADGSIDVEVTEPDGTRTSFSIEDTGEQMIARDAEGNVYSSVDRDRL